MKQTEIYSCFPGTGKSYLYQMAKETDLIVLDSDSSTFDKADFPRNYIEHIKSNIGKADIILVSSHADVRQMMAREGIAYKLAYPLYSCCSEYLLRYEKRGSDFSFYDAMWRNWDSFILSCQLDHSAAEHIVLDSNQYLTDVVNLAHHL